MPFGRPGACAKGLSNGPSCATRSAYPDEAAAFERRLAGELPADFDTLVKSTPAAFAATHEAVASRKSSQKALAACAPQRPEMLGGSADLTVSNLTDVPGCGSRHISYGGREFGMAAGHCAAAMCWPKLWAARRVWC